MEWRAQTRRRVPSFVGKLVSTDDGVTDAARRADDLTAEYIRAKHDRR